MALKAFTALTDKALAEKYEYVAPDLTRARKPFLAALDKAAKQFEEGKPQTIKVGKGRDAETIPHPLSLWSAANNIVRFTPKLGEEAIAIEGETVFHIPAERFTGALAELRKSVEAGELDDVLSDALSVDPAKNPGRAASAQGERKGERAGWTPERRAKFAETQAKKAATKAK